MKNKKLLGGLSAAGVVGVIGAGLYLAAPASAGAPSASASPSMNARHDRWPGRHGRFDGRHDGHHMRGGFGVHGQATVRRGNGFVQVDWQRGQVTAVAGGTLTVRSADGATWQWRTDQKTLVRRDGQRSALDKLAKNDFVIVFGPEDKGIRTAERVIAPKNMPPHAPKAPGQPPSPSPS